MFNVKYQFVNKFRSMCTWAQEQEVQDKERVLRYARSFVWILYSDTVLWVVFSDVVRN